MLILLSTCFVCAAQEIVTDGDFSDWLDKPKITVDDLPAIEQDNEPLPETENNSLQPEGGEGAFLPDGDERQEDDSGEGYIEPAGEEAIPAAGIEIEKDGDIAADNDNNSPKYKITQLSWSMSEDFDILYIALRLSHGKDAVSTAVTCELITDFGSFEAVTNYDLSDASVFTVINDSDIVSNEGSCREINKQTTFLEYGIPIGQMIQDMKWGFEMKMRLHTEDDTEPKKGYIIISTISSGPAIGVVIAGIVAAGGFYLMKRKKRI